MPLLLTADQAAKYTGYANAQKFRHAVTRGKMPKAFDRAARPQLWSRLEIEDKLSPSGMGNRDTDAEEIERRLGLL